MVPSLPIAGVLSNPPLPGPSVLELNSHNSFKIWWRRGESKQSQHLTKLSPSRVTLCLPTLRCKWPCLCKLQQCEPLRTKSGPQSVWEGRGCICRFMGHQPSATHFNVQAKKKRGCGTSIAPSHPKKKRPGNAARPWCVFSLWLNQPNYSLTARPN